MKIQAFAVVFLTSAFCLRAPAQSYLIDWYKVAGGGGTSTGSVYAISGTIGQPDASAGGDLYFEEPVSAAAGFQSRAVAL
jgi:hypothetical protein